MIELNKLNKTYGTHRALADVTIKIPQGQIFGVIGRSGAGKSTLLRCINLLERPDSGAVLIDGQDLTTLPSNKLMAARHKIGMIFQHFNLLNSKTVFDNIALPMRIQGLAEEKINSKITELLQLVDLEDKKTTYPSKLSGGQKQRVAIARALSCEPEVLLCDEATSALDPQTTDAILDLLQKINQIYGITIVLITHEMEAVKRICHSLCLMQSGKVAEVASLQSIFNDPQSLARQMLFAQLAPELPATISAKLTQTPNNKPVLRLYFAGHEATVPFISQISRELNIDINILLANIDNFDANSCGVLIIETEADAELLQAFTARCTSVNLTWEILGYVATSTN